MCSYFYLKIPIIPYIVSFKQVNRRLNLGGSLVHETSLVIRRDYVTKLRIHGSLEHLPQMGIGSGWPGFANRTADGIDWLVREQPRGREPDQKIIALYPVQPLT